METFCALYKYTSNEMMTYDDNDNDNDDIQQFGIDQFELLCCLELCSTEVRGKQCFKFCFACSITVPGIVTQHAASVNRRTKVCHTAGHIACFQRQAKTTSNIFR